MVSDCSSRCPISAQCDEESVVGVGNNGHKQVAKDVSDAASLFAFTLTNGRASGDSRVRPGVGKLDDFTWTSRPRPLVTAHAAAAR